MGILEVPKSSTKRVVHGIDPILQMGGGFCPSDQKTIFGHSKACRKRKSNELIAKREFSLITEMFFPAIDFGQGDLGTHAGRARGVLMNLHAPRNGHANGRYD